jgi:hypothetical protein
MATRKVWDFMCMPEKYYLSVLPGDTFLFATAYLYFGTPPMGINKKGSSSHTISHTHNHCCFSD